MLLLLLLALVVSACLPAASSPSTTPPPPQPPATAPWHALDDTWGPYLAERQWGNPREAVRRGDGWSFTYEKALSTPYRFGEDGIAGVTDRDLSVAFAFAFFRPGQPYLTERLYGLDGPSGQYGETIREDRVFYENTPTYSHMRYGYNYPFQPSVVGAVIEYAKHDSQALVAQVTLSGLADTGGAPVHLVPQVWFHIGEKDPWGSGKPQGSQVNHVDEHTWDAAYPGGHFVVLAGQPPDSWQITANEYPARAAINAALVNEGTLANRGEGDKAAWDFGRAVPRPGARLSLRVGPRARFRHGPRRCLPSPGRGRRSAGRAAG